MLAFVTSSNPAVGKPSNGSSSLQKRFQALLYRLFSFFRLIAVTLQFSVLISGTHCIFSETQLLKHLRGNI
jgi:hypothetical protein